MKRLFRILLSLAAVGLLAAAAPRTALQLQNEALFAKLRQEHGLDDATMQRLRAIFERSGFIGQGNPAVSRHPQTPEQCRAARERVPPHGDQHRRRGGARE